MSTITIPGHLAASLFLLALVGCSDGTLPKDNLLHIAVSGTVTLDGQPLARGKIQFDPVKGDQTPTTVAVGDINDGKYAIDRASGPVPGQYKVSISSVPVIKIGPDDGPGPRPKMEPERVPAQYNIKTTLTTEITDGVKPIDFDLKGK